jgi:4-hydroxy-3-polyprenylbenzoate decarboxylase
MSDQRIVLGISGASGVPIAVRTAEVLADRVELVTIVSDAAKRVMAHETGDAQATLAHLDDISAARYDESEIHAAVASGSVDVAGMAIVPASMNTVAAIAGGHADNLLRRTADVCLKERRRLVVVPRESPLSQLHLENLAKLASMGVDVVPPVLGFYYEPESVEDVVDHTVGKILERFDIEHDLYASWGDLTEK